MLTSGCLGQKIHVCLKTISTQVRRSSAFVSGETAAAAAVATTMFHHTTPAAATLDYPEHKLSQAPPLLKGRCQVS